MESSKWMDHMLCVDIVIMIVMLPIIKDVSKQKVPLVLRNFVNQVMFSICEHYRRL